MLQQKQKNRLLEIAEHAAELFMWKRYEHTQMLDVAQKMNISVGTLYLYVKSKKALFDFTLKLIFSDYALKDDVELPLQEMDHNHLIKHVIDARIKKHMTEITAIIDSSLEKSTKLKR